VFSNFLIGLREGLEASLVVGILVAYLVKTGRRDKLTPLWVGVGLAVGVSLGFGAILTYGSSAMTFEAQEAFGGVMSIIAVGWMVFWMKRTARSIKGELHGKIDAALALGPMALAATATIAVGREGLETALFLWTNIQATGDTAAPVVGAVLGLATAVVLGYLIYRQAIAIDLARFFTITGALLIVVAAGVLAYGFHDLQEAGVLPGLENTAYDITAWYSASSWYGTLLKGVLNFSPNPTVLEVVVWFVYLVPTMFLFFRGTRSSARPVAARATGLGGPATSFPTS
jgi:high-affinity iron transporter